LPLKSWWKFLYLGIIWGATFLWLKIALDELGPLTLNAIRLTVAAIGLFVVARLTGSTWPGRKFLPAMAFLGIFNIALPFALITWSELYITTGLVSILNSTVPLFTILLAFFFVPDDRFTLARGAGLALGFGGVVLLVLNKVGNGLHAVEWGAGVTLLASLSYAIAAIYARRKMPEVSPAMIAFGQSIFANLALWPLALIFESPIRIPQQPLTWLALFWLGIAATGIGTALYYYLLREVGPTRTTLTTYIFPLVGVLLGWIFLSEQPDWRLVVGGMLVVSGVALVNARKANKKQAVLETGSLYE
jgi:drug/metabolite transporter (DMT)-like permease